MTDVSALAEQIVFDRMEHYGYPPGLARTTAAKMAQGAERGDYHRRSGCESGENGWDCFDPDTGQSRHPIEDELEQTAEFVMWVLEHPALQHRTPVNDRMAAEGATPPHPNTMIGRQ